MMSESEYEEEMDNFSEEYEDEQRGARRQRLSMRARSSTPADAKLRTQRSSHRDSKPPSERRQTRGRVNPVPQELIERDQHSHEPHRYAEDDYGLDEQEGDDQANGAEDDQYSIFNLEIAQILWKRQRDDGQTEYLVKYRNKSYLHTDWLLEGEMDNFGKLMKNKISRFNRTFIQRLSEGAIDFESIEEGNFFDQSYLEVDRVLTSTEMFSVIHPKKAAEINGKWSESLLLVVSKLLNFTKNSNHYGVLFSEPVDPKKDNCKDYLNVITEPMDLGTILNKVYMDLYKDPSEFWRHIGLVWRNCLSYNSNLNSDLHVLGATLKQCSIFLYNQWFHLSDERYRKVKEEFETKQLEAKREAALAEANQETPKLGQINGGKTQKIEEEIKKQQHVVKKQEDEALKSKQGGNLIIKPDEGVAACESQEDKNEGKAVRNQAEAQNQEYQNKNSSENSESNLKSRISQEVDDREFLCMEEFYERNILLNERKVEFPKTLQELDLLNPQQFRYDWLNPSDSQTHAKYMSHSFEHIDIGDMKLLDINTNVNKLYMVKWCNLSYSEATWERESNIINAAEKINEFKNINKALTKQTRQQMDQQKECHRILMECDNNPKRRMSYTNVRYNEIKNRLFFYDISSRKEHHQYRIQAPPIYRNYKYLRSYQLESLNWLIKSWYQGRNIILADEMGLGKTIQSIAFLYHLFSVENVKGPFLIIAPLTTLEHWRRTVEEWTTMNGVLYYDQNGESGRRSIQYYEWYHTNINVKGSAMHSDLHKFQVLITSYEVFLMDFPTIIVKIPIQFVIVDEAHRLKNKNAKILNTLKKLSCKRVLLLTGTPIQNNTGQLWSLLNYLHPERFGDSQWFKRQFGDLSSQEQVQRLNILLKPYMLRRMKEDVEQSIPPLQETIIDVEMTNMQKTIYRALYEKNKSLLTKGLSATGSCNTNLNNLEIQLRKCCNHPFLIRELQKDLLRDCHNEVERIEKMVTSSGKMVLVEKLLEKCKRDGKKVLIFSQFTHMLQLLGEFLKQRGYKFERIDGQIKAKERQSSIDRYNNPAKNRDVFLLSTKAGGVGINLTSANVVIIYDSDWNPQNDVQATARAHRIGQKSEVLVYRLITCNTYETEMFERATQKLGLDKAIFMSGSFKEAGQHISENKLTRTEMETLLKRGILGFLENSKQDQDEQFKNQNVDDFIERNSRIAKYSLINGSCSFSKRRFVSENSDNQLKINDPNFWNIVLKSVESPAQTLLKKVKDPQNFRTPQGQVRLMHEASQLLNVVIENKLSLSSFNADDQINLSEFLNFVNQQRLFSKHYRDLASVWLEEICKPSRRFKRFTIDDLLPKKPIGPPAKKSSARIGGQEDQNIFEDDNEEPEDEELSEGKAKLNELKKEDNLKKLCSFCEKPKCTLYCNSFCRRAFHQVCKQKAEAGVLNIDECTEKVEPSELKQEDQILKSLIDCKFVCSDCQSNQVACFICNVKGSYFGAQYNKNKRNKGKKDNEKEELVQKKRRNDVTKCSTANCAKFFHQKCIETYNVKELFKFIDVNSLHFRCSLHYCDNCGISGDTMSILQCVRCPKALHIRCMAKDKNLKLSKKHFLCEAHFKNKKDFKKASQRYARNLPKPKQRVEKAQAKKKQKQSDSQSGQCEAGQIVQPVQPTIMSVFHSYSTRRNKLPEDTTIMAMGTSHANITESPPPLPPMSSPMAAPMSVRKGEKRQNNSKDKVTLLTYEQLGLTSIADFDYKNFNKDWCRYCGSRYSSNFTQGPWGSKTLCTVHYINWKQNRTLNLSAYPQKPQQPIDKYNQQELKYISTAYSKEKGDVPMKSFIDMLEKKMIKKNHSRG